MRIDMSPTDTYGNFKIRLGLFLENGASIVPGGVNFTIHSSGAKSCSLVLYHSHEKEPFAVIPFPESYRIGSVFAMIVFDLDYENIEYGFYVDGDYNFNGGDVFDKSKCLLDPYAKLISGRNDNHSWNCGWEGDYDLPDGIKFLRHKMIKNAAAILLTSVGIPMILAGDEFGNTQYGNNNPYCQDSKISWLDWTLADKNKNLLQFFKKMIAFRKNHPVLMRTSPATPVGYPAISIHGTEAWSFDSSSENRVVGIMFTGKTPGGKDDFIYIGVNAHWDAHEIWLPALPQNISWKIAVNTDLGDNSFYDEPINLDTSQKFLIGARSVIICTATN